MTEHPEGPELAAAIAVEVMKLEPVKKHPNHFIKPFDNEGRAVVICCGDCGSICQQWPNPPLRWRPDTDPTTFFRDVVPEMQNNGWNPHMGPTFRSLKLEFRWSTIDERGDMVEHRARHENIAAAGCQAALAAVRAKGASDA